jgi:hypothetical protein
MKPKNPPRAEDDPDGRYTAQYLVDRCVCAYCWQPLAQRYDEDARRWFAECANNPAHVGYHHRIFKEKQIDAHTFEAHEVSEFYRRTPYAAGLGYAPPLEGQALTDHAAHLKRMLGRDDSGL